MTVLKDHEVGTKTADLACELDRTSFGPDRGHSSIRHRHAPVSMTMSSEPDPRVQRAEVVTSAERQRRWSVADKVRLVEEAMQPISSMSFVARRAGIAPNHLFAWKRRILEGGEAPSGA